MKTKKNKTPEEGEKGLGDVKPSEVNPANPEPNIDAGTPSEGTNMGTEGSKSENPQGVGDVPTITLEQRVLAIEQALGMIVNKLEEGASSHIPKGEAVSLDQSLPSPSPPPQTAGLEQLMPLMQLMGGGDSSSDNTFAEIGKMAVLHYQKKIMSKMLRDSGHHE